MVTMASEFSGDFSTSAFAINGSRMPWDTPFLSP